MFSFVTFPARDYVHDALVQDGFDECLVLYLSLAGTIPMWPWLRIVVMNV